MNGAKSAASVYGQVRLREPTWDIRKDRWMQTYNPIVPGVPYASTPQIKESWGNRPAQPHEPPPPSCLLLDYCSHSALVIFITKRMEEDEEAKDGMEKRKRG